MEKITHGKFQISYDEEKEVFYTHVETEGSQERVERPSLKKLKDHLDKLDRKKFERIAVFVKTHSYSYRSGDERKYTPQYEEATITSISPAGRIYFVRKGKKNAEQAGYWRDDMILDTDANRKIIAEIEEQGAIEFNANKSQDSMRKKLKAVDNKKLFEQVYGREQK